MTGGLGAIQWRTETPICGAQPYTAPFAPGSTGMKAVSIRFVGQFTRQKTDISLEIAREPENAIAVRGLVGRFQGTAAVKAVDR
jgi:hypothetical protein